MKLRIWLFLAFLFSLSLVWQSEKRREEFEICSQSTKCKRVFRNPSRVWDPFAHLGSETFIQRKKDLGKGRFYGWLERRLLLFPTLFALERAVWFGDTTGFSNEVQTFYKESGLLALLALSGQHVMGLYCVLEVVLSAFFEVCFKLAWSSLAQILLFIKRHLLWCAASLLFLSSDYSASMQRTWVMVSAFQILRVRGYAASELQVLTTSVALLLLLQGKALNGVGFTLSFVSTLLLCAIPKDKIRARISRLAFFSLMMPTFLLPWTAHYFSKVSLFVFVLQIPFSLLWDLVLIPLGYLLPLILVVEPRFFLGCIDEQLHWIFKYHSVFSAFSASSYITVVSPTLWEVFLVEICLVGAVRRILARCNARV